MFYTLGLHKLPFEPDCNQIIFIEGNHDEDVVKLIRRHFHDIRDAFKSRGYDFCYIPFLKHDLVSKERLHYNAPYAKSSAEADFMVNDNFILDYMLHPENREKIPPSLLYFHPDCWDDRYPDAANQFRGVSISASSFDGDFGLNKVLTEIRDDIEEHRKNQPQFSLFDEPFKHYDEEEDKTPMCAECSRFDNEGLDDESMALMEEIEERIDKLRQKGIDSYIIESLFKNRKRKLSRMLITKDSRIILPDYFASEILMTPLPKALYLLYLKHPEGIMFSYLPDFKEELFELYQKVKGPFYNYMQAKKSIDELVDPTKNSINEKCSRIKAAFVSKFDDHLAQYYYIDGEWGEAKKIRLPRDLVKWEE